jgi:hypothetical protein
MKYFALALLMAVSLDSFSQTQGVLGKRFFDNWSVGIGGGPNIFFGDLKVHQFWPATTNMSEVKFGGTFTLTRQLSHVFAIRGQFLYSEISGTKRTTGNGEPYNQYFDGNILEGNLNTTINFSNLFSTRYKPKRKFFVYGIIGLGASSWNSNVKELGTGTPLRTSDSLGKWSTAIVGIGGIGAFVNMGDKINLGIEWTLHGVNSDKVDVTTGGFKYDAYSMVSVNLTYNFNKRNPGKEPDTNQNKIYVPVYIQVPAKESKPADTVAIETVEIDSVLVDSTFDATEYPAEPDAEEISPSPRSAGTTYSVQIFALKTDKYNVQQVKEKFYLEQEVYKDFSNGWYCFSVGSFAGYSDAKELKSQMRKRGFKGAFITRFKNGVRVPAHGKK